MNKTISYKKAIIEVTDDGVVLQNGKVLKQSNLGQNHEYRFAQARTGKGKRKGKWVLVNVGRAVCTAFHGKPRRGFQVDHIDSNPQNNHADNLRWVTRKENNSRPHAMEQRNLNRKSTSHRHQILVLTDPRTNTTFYFRNGTAAARVMGVSHVAVYLKAGTTRRLKHRWLVDFQDINDLSGEVLSQVIE